METGHSANSGTPTTKTNAEWVQQVMARQQARLNPTTVEAKGEEENKEAPVETVEANPEEASADTVEGEQPEDSQPEGDAETEAEEGPVSETITYKVNGKPVTISLDEAQVQLASAHELKRLKSEIVENYRQSRTEREQLAQTQMAYASRLQEVAAYEASRLPSEQQMQAMLNAGKEREYLMAKAAHEKFAALKGETEKAREEAERSQQGALQEQARHMVEEVKTANTEFAKPEHWQKVADFASKYGFTADEVGNWVDSRVWLAFDAFRKAQEQIKNASQSARKVLAKAQPLKPAARTSVENLEGKRFAELKGAFSKKPSVETGVELMKARLQQRMQG